MCSLYPWWPDFAARSESNFILRWRHGTGCRRSNSGLRGSEAARRARERKLWHRTRVQTLLCRKSTDEASFPRSHDSDPSPSSAESKGLGTWICSLGALIRERVGFLIWFSFIYTTETSWPSESKHGISTSLGVACGVGFGTLVKQLRAWAKYQQLKREKVGRSYVHPSNMSHSSIPSVSRRLFQTQVYEHACSVLSTGR